jgi:3-deoxy-D-arabino-heptulosonate 7-phosphate (DAHP) synthase
LGRASSIVPVRVPEGALAIAVAAVHSFWVALAVGGAAEGVDLGVHQRLGHALHHRAQQIDIALFDELAHLFQTVHRDLDHRVSPFNVFGRT